MLAISHVQGSGGKLYCSGNLQTFLSGPSWFFMVLHVSSASTPAVPSSCRDENGERGWILLFLDVNWLSTQGT